MLDRLQRILRTKEMDEVDLRGRLAGITQGLLLESRGLDQANFTCVDTRDLSRAFEWYDREFFSGALRGALGTRPVRFKLSRRMTSAGGHTIRYRSRDGATESFEIAVSTTLLFNTFHDVDRPVVVNGLRCHNRLEAMLRILEHELVHLAEMIVWDRSSCSAPRFQGIAERLFGHREHKHQLVTPVERAAKRFGVKPGDHVVFRFEGKQYSGRVNRINKRATVLVEDCTGELYTDGKQYRKYYVPLRLLEPRESSV